MQNGPTETTCGIRSSLCDNEKASGEWKNAGNLLFANRETIVG
jgi:hypothetical protein